MKKKEIYRMNVTRKMEIRNRRGDSVSKKSVFNDYKPLMGYTFLDCLLGSLCGDEARLVVKFKCRR